MSEHSTCGSLTELLFEEPGGVPRGGRPVGADDVLRGLIEASPDLIAVQDRNHRYLAFNRSYAQEFQKAFGREIRVGDSMRELLSHLPADQASALDLWGRALRGETFTVVREFGEEDRSRNWYEFRFSPIRDATGIVGAAHVACDVTHVHASQQALRDSEERYRTLFMNMTEGFALGEVIRADGAPPDFRFIEMNDAFECQSGLSRERALGRPIRQVLPNIEESWIETYCEVALGGPARRFEDYNRDLDRHFSVYCFSPAPGRFAIMFTDVSQRTRGSDALREREAELRTAQRIAHVGSWSWTVGTPLLEASEEVSRIYGREPRASIPVNDSEELRRHYTPEGWERRTAAFRKALADGMPWEREEQIVRPDGSIRWVHFHGEPERDAEGRIVKLRGTIQDITDRKRVEQALRDSEERFRTLTDAMPQIVCALGWDGRVEYVNPSWTDYSGLDLAATMQRGWPGLLHPHDLEAARDCWRKARALRTPQDVEVRYRARDGSYRWFVSRLAPIGDDSGRIVRFIGTAMDIHDRKQAQDRADWLARFPEENPNPVVRLGDDLTVVYANDAAIVSGFCLARGHRAPPHIAQAAERVMRDRCVVTTEADLGSTVFAVTAVPVGTEVSVYAQDVTALRRAEEALREGNRRKDEFLGMLSHELRNPLAPIRNSMYVLRHTQPGNDKALRAQAVIERQTEHLTRLVDDLLDVTRIARGKVELRRSAIDLRDIVLRVADDFRPMMEQRGITLHVAVPATRTAATADAVRLTQVVGNLVHNAAKFTRRGERVALTVRAQGADALISVRDTGAGIDPSLLPRVFEAFVQGERTLARTDGGLGLGLALVKGIVELHGGSVGVESGGKGKGSEFLVRLPLAQPVSPESRSELVDEGRVTSLRVLVVDDNRDAAESLAEVVRTLGHSAEVTYDGSTAVEKALADLPDVILCDLGLPGMSGYEVAQALRSGAPAGTALRLIAVSGYAQPEDVRCAIDAGFDAHLPKPCAAEDIDRLLSERRRSSIH